MPYTVKDYVEKVKKEHPEYPEFLKQVETILGDKLTVSEQEDALDYLGHGSTPQRAADFIKEL